MAKIVITQGYVGCSKSFWWRHIKRPKQWQKVPSWKLLCLESISQNACHACRARYAATRGSQSHIRRQDKCWRNIASAEMNCSLHDEMLLFLQECVGCSLNLRENMGSNWVSELPCLTSIYGRTPSPNQEKAQFGYTKKFDGRWFNTFLCPGQHSKPSDEGCTTMAGYSGLSRAALVSVQKSEVTCKLVSKATPHVSHDRRVCSRYIRTKSKPQLKFPLLWVPCEISRHSLKNLDWKLDF